MHVAAAILLLVVRIYNVGDTSARDLDRARHVSGEILKRTGIELIWVDCTRSSDWPAASRNCADVPQTDEVIVRIVRGPSRQPGRAAIDTLGDAYVDTAVGSGSLATVYADRIATMASASGVDAGTLFGRVMAHEIGHLLLGTTAHAPYGIMRAQWSSSLLQRGFSRDWQFSRDDVERLDQNLSIRSKNQALSPEPEP